jgi:hypothetical protein
LHAGAHSNESSQDVRFLRISVINSVEDSHDRERHAFKWAEDPPMSHQYWLGEAQLERIKPRDRWPTACRRPSRDQWDRSRHPQGLEMEDAPEVTESP